MKPTFDQQLAKLKVAYHKGRLNPYCVRHGFAGIILNSALWSKCDDLSKIEGEYTALNIVTVSDVKPTKELIHKESQGLYELADIMRLERVFLGTLQQHLDHSVEADIALYDALMAAVKELKALHEASGETCFYEDIGKADYRIRIEDRVMFTDAGMNEGATLGDLLSILFDSMLDERSDKIKRHREQLERQRKFN